jgi:uncharacterized protein (DUF2141 family)
MIRCEGCTTPPPKTWLGRHRIRWKRLWGGVAAVMSLVLISGSAAAFDLKVVIDGVRSSTGSILIGLYDSNEHFQVAIKASAKVGLLNDRARLVGISMRAIGGMQSVIFTNLEPGPYAIIVIHDENDNGKLDTNFFGVPTEGYGFSNNAEGFLGPPSFKEVAVTLDQADRTVEIALGYRTPAAQWFTEAPGEGTSDGAAAAEVAPRDK